MRRRSGSATVHPTRDGGMYGPGGEEKRGIQTWGVSPGFLANVIYFASVDRLRILCASVLLNDVLTYATVGGQ